jgi:GNAT superfamily N-acetyltransferase
MNRYKKVQTEKQIGKVAQLARIIWTGYFSPMIGDNIVDYLLKQLQSKNAITREIQNGYQYYLIPRSKKVIGYFAILDKHESSELFLSKLYLLDSERGKGFGKSAMTFIETLARKKKSR